MRLPGHTVVRAVPYSEQRALNTTGLNSGNVLERIANFGLYGREETRALYLGQTRDGRSSLATIQTGKTRVRGISQPFASR